MIAAKCRTKVAVGLGFALIAAACGSDDKSVTTEPPTSETTVQTVQTVPPSTTPAVTLPEGVAMTVTYDINPDAAWDDGTPITVADFECTWRASLNTPGSVRAAGYYTVTSVDAGATDKQVVVSFSDVYGGFRDLFAGIIKADAVQDCNDVSREFAADLPFSGREWRLESWSATGSVLVPNEHYWGDAPNFDRLVFLPNADPGTYGDPDRYAKQLTSGAVDFIRVSAGSITDVPAGQNIAVSTTYGGEYLERMEMNLLEGRPFSDPALREAFYKSIDLDAFFAQLNSSSGADGELVTCGPIMPGPYCPADIFGNKYDQAAADQILIDAGYTKNGDGLWNKDGTVPQIRWMINTGNTRRENAQSYLIPLLRGAGFDLVDDNCMSSCSYGRLDAGDYDLTMYGTSIVRDPVLWFAGDPSVLAWNNNAAIEALDAANGEVDMDARFELLKTALTELSDGYFLIPLYQYPTLNAYRSDRVGNVDGQLANYRAFSDTFAWEDVDGDGQVAIGAEVWPSCLNPITECAEYSPWFSWTVTFPLLPSAFDTTNDGRYEITALLASEPVVTVAD